MSPQNINYNQILNKTITNDVRKVGGLMHVDAHSVARIQQGGVFYVTINIQQLFLNWESPRFSCEKKRKTISDHLFNQILVVGLFFLNPCTKTHTHTRGFLSEDLRGGKTAGIWRSRGVGVFLIFIRDESGV